MATQATLSDYGISVGTLPSGPLGKISDVPGVTVGHCTVDTQTQKTGVTVVMPCADDMFAQKLPAAACVLNGFGKTAGLVQIGELGTLLLDDGSETVIEEKEASYFKLCDDEDLF